MKLKNATKNWNATQRCTNLDQCMVPVVVICMIFYKMDLKSQKVPNEFKTFIKGHYNIQVLPDFFQVHLGPSLKNSSLTKWLSK